MQHLQREIRGSYICCWKGQRRSHRRSYYASKCQ